MTGDGEVVPSGDASSISSEENPLKAGDRFAAKGDPDEALAAYHRHIALCEAKIKSGTSLRAFDELRLAAPRIGHLASLFLLAGKFGQALACADEGLAGTANWPDLELARAYALMFLGSEEQARSIYLRHRRTKFSPRKTYARVILENFADLRQAGYSHPLMDEIERKFIRARRTKPVTPKVAELAKAQPQPEPVAVTPPLVEITNGDKLMDRGKFEKALAIYRSGIANCKAAIAADDAAIAAHRDFDVLISRIGVIAFRFLEARRDGPAREAIDEVILHRPDWVWPHMIRAHALMYGPNKTAAHEEYRKYAGRTLENGVSWEDRIREDFARLRAAGAKHPFMDGIEREFALKR